MKKFRLSAYAKACVTVCEQAIELQSEKLHAKYAQRHGDFWTNESLDFCDALVVSYKLFAKATDKKSAIEQGRCIITMARVVSEFECSTEPLIISCLIGAVVAELEAK